MGEGPLKDQLSELLGHDSSTLPSRSQCITPPSLYPVFRSVTCATISCPEVDGSPVPTSLLSHQPPPWGACRRYISVTLSGRSLGNALKDTGAPITLDLGTSKKHPASPFGRLLQTMSPHSKREANQLESVFAVKGHFRDKSGHEVACLLCHPCCRGGLYYR